MKYQLLRVLVLTLTTGVAVSSDDLEPSNQHPSSIDNRVFEQGPSTSATSTVVIPLVRAPSAGIPKVTAETLFLHVEVKGECGLGYYAKHEHQTFVTKGSASGPRVPVASLELISRIAGIEKTKGCPNAEWCARTEYEYNLGCRNSCAMGRAAQPGFGAWQTNWTCVW